MTTCIPIPSQRINAQFRYTIYLRKRNYNKENGKKNYKKIKRIIPCDYSVSIFLSFLPSFCIWSSDTPVLEVLKKEGTWSITVLILSKPRSPRLAYWMAFSCICYYYLAIKKSSILLCHLAFFLLLRGERKC